MTRPPWRCEKHGVESVEWGKRGKKPVRVCPVCVREDARRLKRELDRHRNGKRAA